MESWSIQRQLGCRPPLCLSAPFLCSFKPKCLHTFDCGAFACLYVCQCSPSKFTTICTVAPTELIRERCYHSDGSSLSSLNYADLELDEYWRIVKFDHGGPQWHSSNTNGIAFCLRVFFLGTRWCYIKAGVAEHQEVWGISWKPIFYCFCLPLRPLLSNSSPSEHCVTCEVRGIQKGKGLMRWQMVAVMRRSARRFSCVPMHHGIFHEHHCLHLQWSCLADSVNKLTNRGEVCKTVISNSPTNLGEMNTIIAVVTGLTNQQKMSRW